MICFTLVCQVSEAQTNNARPSDPLHVRTMLISKFALFIETWDVKTTTKHHSFTIVFIGNKSNYKVKEAYKHVKSTYETGKVKILNRPVTVKLYSNLSEFKESGVIDDIFYINGIKKSTELNSLLQYANTNNILTLGDGKELCAKGVHITFHIVYVNREYKVAFSVNKCAIEKAGIKFTYQVYEMADRVIKNCND